MSGKRFTCSNTASHNKDIKLIESDVWTGRGFYYALQNLPGWLKWMLDYDPHPSAYERINIADELGLHYGAYVCGEWDQYRIIKMLGEGGFGAVFEVEAISNGKRLAAKVEKRVPGRRSKLKMEWKVLQIIRGDGIGTEHFTTAIDYSSFRWFRLFVMTKVGKSLDDLKAAYLGRVFSLATSFGVSLQCLEAIRTIHHYGFVHRDLKPSNCAIGLSDKAHVVFIPLSDELLLKIYVIDFGIARKITKDNGDLKEPRRYVTFHGTIRYASRACHRNMEGGFSDDCESWIYMLFDISITLPWRSLNNRHEILAQKDKHMKDVKVLVARFPCANEMRRLTEYIAGLTYADIVDYDYICALLKEAIRVANVDVDAPYDWEIPKLFCGK